MDFLSEYGLFLAKTVTFVVAILVVVGFIMSMAISQKKQAKSESIKVKKINDKLDSFKQTLEHSLLSEKTLKEQAKAEKKRKKAASKQELEKATEQRLFVLTFDGDIKASATDQLREEVSAVLTIARPKDEVVLKLESGGGLVHSYGLAASQLSRIKDQGIPLTVCVDKVAASGGYMMACVGDKICAAPFAVIGSIGVVAQIPNFHRVLKNKDVDVEVLTAGEYKRTLTLFGENTEKGREKFIEDLENTHELFKRFVKQKRPSVNIDEVATGEIWFGQDAKDKQLIDKIITSDSYIIDKAANHDVYEVSLDEKKGIKEKLGLSAQKAIEGAVSSTVGKLRNFHFFN